MPILVWTFRVLLFLVFFGFALLNTDRVTVDLLFVRWNAPLALVLLAFFAMGALLGVALLTPRLMRHRSSRSARDGAIAGPATLGRAVEPPRLS